MYAVRVASTRAPEDWKKKREQTVSGKIGIATEQSRKRLVLCSDSTNVGLSRVSGQTPGQTLLAPCGACAPVQVLLTSTRPRLTKKHAPHTHMHARTHTGAHTNTHAHTGPSLSGLKCSPVILVRAAYVFGNAGGTLPALSTRGWMRSVRLVTQRAFSMRAICRRSLRDSKQKP